VAGLFSAQAAAWGETLGLFKLEAARQLVAEAVPFISLLGAAHLVQAAR